ncbi:MAG: cytochrome c oxidase subunit II [Planctomycetota bacterium]|jgi:cytochrome c oxidase subunit 2
MTSNLFANLLMASTGGGFWMPPDASTIAPTVDRIFNFITWLSAFFFVLIVVLMARFMWKYRRQSHTQRAESQVSHNTPLEVTWTIIPLILVIAIFYAGMNGYIRMSQAPAGSYEINVTGQKWTWTFEHRNGCQQVGELYIPVGRPVKLILSSQDVLHSVFIPAFRVKQDAVPGRLTTLWFEATEPGEYDLFCTEYCGTDHSQMNARVYAYEEDEFQAQLADCANWFDQGLEQGIPLPQLGARLYNRCQSCHSLDGTNLVGPTWEGLWERTESGETVFTDGSTLRDLIGDGRMFASPEDYLLQSVLDPQQKLVMNYTGSMPTFRGQLNEPKITALIEFIKNLDQFDDQGNPLP